jgi:hypothetical protein
MCAEVAALAETQDEVHRPVVGSIAAQLSRIVGV